MVDKAEKAIDFVEKHNKFNIFTLFSWMRTLLLEAPGFPNIEIKAHTSKLRHCCGPGSQEACPQAQDGGTGRVGSTRLSNPTGGFVKLASRSSGMVKAHFSST